MAKKGAAKKGGTKKKGSKKKGSKALITSNGCKSKKHKIGVKVNFVPNPGPPAATSAKDTAEAKCK